MNSLAVASVLAALALPVAARSQEPPPAGAQDEESRRKLEEQLAKELGAAPGQPKSGAGATPPAAGPVAEAGQGATGGNPMARLLLLPDISAIGSFAGAFDSYDVARRSPRPGPFGPTDKPTALFDELELGMQSVVDPYGRADIFISFTPDGASVEEAYFTTLTLPGGLQVRAGKLFSPFGRQNQLHPHVWDFVDAPLGSTRVLARDVLSGPGVDVSWLTPLPWFAELHLAGQGTNPDPGAVDPVDRPTAIARLLQYGSLGEATTVGLGVSAARRSEATGAFRDLGGADLYLRVRPPASRAYLAVQAELFGRRFRNVEGGRSDLGGYAQALWRQDAYFGYGVRYDDGPSAGEAASGRERRWSGVGIWQPTEFERVRLQLSYDRRPLRQDGVEALLGFEFIIGAHGAHPF